jgi:hypothetical protein
MDYCILIEASPPVGQGKRLLKLIRMQFCAAKQNMYWFVSFQNTNKFPNFVDYCKLVEASQAAGQGKNLKSL